MVVSSVVQIKLMKILSLLGNGNKKSSEQTYTILGDIMRNAIQLVISGMLFFMSAYAVYIPTQSYLNLRLTWFQNFWRSVICKLVFFVFWVFGSSRPTCLSDEESDNHNLKYLGIDALRRVIRISPEIA